MLCCVSGLGNCSNWTDQTRPTKRTSTAEDDRRAAAADPIAENEAKTKTSIIFLFFGSVVRVNVMWCGEGVVWCCIVVVVVVVIISSSSSSSSSS